MKDLIVCMAASRRTGLMGEYLWQLEQAGIDTHIEEIAEFPGENVGGFHGWGLSLYRKWTERFRDYQKLVFSDAWDVLFFGSKADVLRKIPDYGVLLAAERVCYPDKELAEGFPGTTAWRFANGGLVAGTPAAMWRWLDAVEHHPKFEPFGMNQRFYNLLARQRSPLIPLDDHTELFYCLFTETDQLAFDEQGLPVNTVLGTHPNFLHASGCSANAGAMATRKRFTHACA